jgi:hypothetical protein
MKNDEEIELINETEILRPADPIDRPMLRGILLGLATFERPMPKLEFDVSMPGNYYLINVKGFNQAHDGAKFYKTFFSPSRRNSKYDNIESYHYVTVGTERQELCIKIRVRKTEYRSMKRGK